LGDAKGWLLGKDVEKPGWFLISVRSNHGNINKYEDPTRFRDEHMGDYREKVRCILKLMIQANQLRVELDTTSRNAKKTHENWQVEPGGVTTGCLENFS